MCHAEMRKLFSERFSYGAENVIHLETILTDNTYDNECHMEIFCITCRPSISEDYLNRKYLNNGFRLELFYTSCRKENNTTTYSELYVLLHPGS